MSRLNATSVSRITSWRRPDVVWPSNYANHNFPCVWTSFDHATLWHLLSFCFSTKNHPPLWADAYETLHFKHWHMLFGPHAIASLFSVFCIEILISCKNVSFKLPPTETLIEPFWSSIFTNFLNSTLSKNLTNNLNLMPYLVFTPN
jgi:hypothetical protein